MRILLLMFGLLTSCVASAADWQTYGTRHTENGVVTAYVDASRIVIDQNFRRVWVKLDYANKKAHLLSGEFSKKSLDFVLSNKVIDCKRQTFHNETMLFVFTDGTSHAVTLDAASVAGRC